MNSYQRWSLLNRIHSVNSIILRRFNWNSNVNIPLPERYLNYACYVCACCALRFTFSVCQCCYWCIGPLMWVWMRVCVCVCWCVLVSVLYYSRMLHSVLFYLHINRTYYQYKRLWRSLAQQPQAHVRTMNTIARALWNWLSLNAVMTFHNFVRNDFSVNIHSN